MPDYRCAECGACYYSRAKLEDLRALQDDRCDECGGELQEVKRHEEEADA